MIGLAYSTGEHIPIVMADVDRSDWQLPAPQTVHLWELHISTALPYLASWQSYLTAEERDRVQRFVKAEAATRFICSRGGLRYLLGRYLHCDPRSLVFHVGDRGKPYLQPARLSFNVSHSGPWVVYALSHCPWVGVDVEHIAPRAHLEGLIRRCLTPQEQAQLPTEDAAKLHQFLTYWTAKEAHLKAVGVGLSYPMAQVQVALSLTPAVSRPVDSAETQGANWTLHFWQPSPAAIAALCVGEMVTSISIRSLEKISL